MSLAAAMEQELSAEQRISHFESLLTGLSEMDDDGYIHQVFIAILEGVDGDENLRLLAEALHQRWLSDAGFAPVAARIAQRLADLKSEEGDVCFSSLVFASIMNDYNDRMGLRRTSRVVFCNSAHFTFEFYALFQTAGELYQSLIRPLFEYLNLLLSDDACDIEIELMSQLVQIHGPVLQQLNPRETQELCVKIRRVLIENDDITLKIRYRLLEIVDLSQNRWDPELLPIGVAESYRKYHQDSAPDVERTFSEMKKPTDLMAESRHRQDSESFSIRELTIGRSSFDLADAQQRRMSAPHHPVARAASFKMPQRSYTVKARPMSSRSFHSPKMPRSPMGKTAPKIIIENGNGRENSLD